MVRRPTIGSDAVDSVTIDELEKRVDAWVSSTEGTAQLLAAKEAARIAAEKVTSDARVEVEQLRQTVTL
jgi:uncharacterized small protein (DUF1192 family)